MLNKHHMAEQPNKIKHRAILDALKAEILGNKYAVNRAFPSEAQISRKYKVSRTTVRKALDALHHEGWIRSVQGRGTFVTRQGAARKIGLIVPRHVPHVKLDRTP